MTSAQDVSLLREKGAELVQVASCVLRNGFSSVSELLSGISAFAVPEPALGAALLKHNPWCDVEDGAVCEKCGACCR